MEHAHGDLVGVCQETGATIPLHASDLVVYRFDLAKCLRLLRNAFQWSGEGGSLEGVHGIYHVGDFQPLAGYTFPAYFVHASNDGNARSAIDTLCARTSGAFLPLTPTERFLKPTLRHVLASRSSQFLALVDAVRWEGDRWLVTDSGLQAVEVFRDRVVPNPSRSDEKVHFPTPTGATWSMLRIHFIDGHQVQVQLGSVSRALTYTQMGMANRRNGKPTVQWELLIQFARSHGRMTWDSPAADRKNKKRKELLANDLKSIFRIDGDPFRFLAEVHGWEAAFPLDWPE